MLITGLLLSSLFGRCHAQDANPESRHVLMFTAEPINANLKREDGTQAHSVTWTREIVRQAVLLAAREECGLSTRDESLGEPVQREADDCIHIHVVVWWQKGIDIRLSRGGEEFYSKSIDIDLSSPMGYVPLVEQMEELSRTEFADALAKKTGYPRREPIEGTEGVVPDEIQPLLQKANHISQYAAIRQLHRLNAKSPNSLQILGALTRGYAHLTQMTLPTLDMRHKVFGARAVLYAQRMIQRQPQSPKGYWHRAYAFTWIGFPNGSIADIERATELATADDETPEWVNLVKLYRDFRFEELGQAANDADSPERQIAGLLWFLASRMVESKAFVIETGKSAIEAAPESLRIISGMSDMAGVAYNHRLTAIGPMIHAVVLREHLKEIDELPAAITDAAETDDDAWWLTGPSAAIQELASDDLSEPSWYVLSGNIRAWNSEHLSYSVVHSF